VGGGEAGLPIALAEELVTCGDAEGHQWGVVGVEADIIWIVGADGLDGDSFVDVEREAEVVAGHDAVPGADAFGGGFEGEVEEVEAEEGGVEEDEGEEEVMEAIPEHRTFNIEHRTSKEIQIGERSTSNFQRPTLRGMLMGGNKEGRGMPRPYVAVDGD
jgi:hypothetical protein